MIYIDISFNYKIRCLFSHSVLSHLTRKWPTRWTFLSQSLSETTFVTCLTYIVMAGSTTCPSYRPSRNSHQQLVSTRVCMTSIPNVCMARSAASVCRVLLSIPYWPSGKFPFECQKIAKNLTFFQKNCQKFSFFSKKLPMAI